MAEHFYAFLSSQKQHFPNIRQNRQLSFGKLAVLHYRNLNFNPG